MSIEDDQMGDEQMDDEQVMAALVDLHRGLDRQGPGDEAFSRDILARLPQIPVTSTVADLGCGSGAASVLLARHLARPVVCVDTSAEFLEGLTARAEAAGVPHLTTALCADMGALDPREHRFDLIWSEGAAYHLTFEGAMRAWRPLLPRGGVAVVSELSWFGPARPRPAADFWAAVYPAMGDEGENVERAERHGFDLVFTQRLPSTAWWQNYYGPLLERIEARTAAASPAMRQVIGETHREIDLFRRYSDAYGYTFYVLAGSGVLQSGVRRT